MDLERIKKGIILQMGAGKIALQKNDLKSAETLIEASLCSVQLLSEVIEPDSGDYGAEQSSSDYIECGGLLWARENIETDGSKYLTFDEASECGAPTKEELEAFIEHTYYGFDKERGVGIFIDRETGVKLELPANGWRDTDGEVRDAGTNGYYWSATQYNSTNAYRLSFNSNSVGVSSYDNKTFGFSVRCVRR